MRAATRRGIPRSAFVYQPGTKTGGAHGRYPINTKTRALNALSRSAQKNTRGSYSTVARAVKRRYGSSINVGGTSRRKK